MASVRCPCQSSRCLNFLMMISPSVNLWAHVPRNWEKLCWKGKLRACGAHRQANCPDLNCLHFLALEVSLVSSPDIVSFHWFPLICSHFSFTFLSGMSCFTSAVVRLLQGELNSCKNYLSLCSWNLFLKSCGKYLVCEIFGQVETSFIQQHFPAEHSSYPRCSTSWMTLLFGVDCYWVWCAGAQHPPCSHAPRCTQGPHLPPGCAGVITYILKLGSWS